MVRSPTEDVRTYWEGRPCAAELASAPLGTPAFFKEVEAAKDRLEPFEQAFADFPVWSGKTVLEIGCGVGTDTVRFARAGARVSAVDLTDAAVRLTGNWLATEGLEATVVQADAESLPFADETFDLVYSWGVLHHVPDTRAAVEEALRVLRPGGEARVMLYARHSWFAAGVWARYGALRGRPWRSMDDVLSSHLESPGTKAYTTTEVARLFGSFTDVSVRRQLTPYDRRVAGPLAGLAGDRLGWFLLVQAKH